MAALRRDLDGRRTALVALVIGLVGAVGAVLGFALDTERGFAAYLAAWWAVALPAFGGFGLLLVGYAGNFRWPAVVRRLQEACAAATIPLAVLFLPLIFWMGHVWPWVHPGPDEIADVQLKAAYLSKLFFVLRAAAYFAILIVPAILLRRWSRHRDDHPEPQVPHGVTVLRRERMLSAAMLPALGVVLTFASIDWIESLDPSWWSTAFGLWFIASALQAGIAVTLLLAWIGTATSAMPLRGAHFHAMGRTLHGFTALWIYIAFFQALLIQIGNVPADVQFYVKRLQDGWDAVLVVVIALRFVVPFLLLFSRKLKFHAGYLAAIAAVILFGVWVDMWWMVVPRIRPTCGVSWTDFASICAIGGLTVAFAAWRQRGTSLLPIGDPYLESALAYEPKY